MFINEIIYKLKNYCFKEGYTNIPSFDVIKGAGTFNPIMIENIIKNNPFKFLSEEWCYRINDSSGLINEEFCMRTSRHLQLQIMDFPGKEKNIVKFFLSLLQEIGINESDYLIEIKESNWTQETLGALGKGYEVILCGLEIAQLTTFDYICDYKTEGGNEIAIGIERIASIKQEVKSIFDLKWDQNFKYSDFFHLYENDILKEKNLLNKEICFENFENKKKEIEYLIQNKMFYKAFEEFSELNYMMGKIEICDEAFQIKKRSIIEELKKISKEIWKNILLNKKNN